MTDTTDTNDKIEETNNLTPITQLPLLPLKDIVVFPHMIVPVFINEDLCVNAVQSAQEGDRKIFLSAFKINGYDGRGLESQLDAPFDVYDVGTVCSIMRTRKLPDGRIKVLIQGLHKAVVRDLINTKPYPLVNITEMPDSSISEEAKPEVEATVRAVRESLERVVGLGKVLSPDILMILEDVSEPAKLSDLVAANLGLKVHEAQTILAVNDPIERLKKVHFYLTKEVEVYQMQMKIQSQAKDEINKMQREHYLREQMRAIKTELGDTEKDDVESLWAKLASLKISEEANLEVSRQIKRLERMHQDSSEATLTRTHIETILSLPWGEKTTDNLDLKLVKAILDEDHYGLEKIKDRILEYLAVKKLNQQAKSPIICFVGPPGVGKTSLGRSIARSLGRKFERISLGGVRDEADIRGHRKTYVGAFPGRIVAAIKKSGSSNPIIMLDELDKLTSDFRGDPASALLEVLDPEQNKDFIDHYLGVAFDLSDVMFIANANTLAPIPAPLRDRLEIIELSGYSEEEKLIIANQYLVPKQIKDTGLDGSNIVFTQQSLKTLIHDYTRESGLRGLDKQIASVCRKMARRIAEIDQESAADEPSEENLTAESIREHLGARKYDRDHVETDPSVGMSLGLAYTSYGGEVLSIECNMIPAKSSKLVLTGQLGDVMRESAQTAMSYIRSKAKRWNISEDALNNFEVHVHVPAGAVPKDGPSAGTALATAMLSAFLRKAPSTQAAMTGEITLHGKVLPIGGVREKTLAARREKISLILLPERNRVDWQDLPEYIKKSVNVKFVTEFDEVVGHLFDCLMTVEEGAPSTITDLAS